MSNEVRIAFRYKVACNVIIYGACVRLSIKR